jgi:hypothetical protein
VGGRAGPQRDAVTGDGDVTGELNGQVQVPTDHGELTVDVWPAYMGLGESTDGVTLIEYAGDPDYQRGQIIWETRPSGEIVGHARIYHPKGVYTHLMFCNGPSEMLVAVEQLEHPYLPDRSGFFDVDVVNKMAVPRRNA